MSHPEHAKADGQPGANPLTLMTTSHLVLAFSFRAIFLESAHYIQASAIRSS